jgi:hypothetical protein
MPNDFTVIMHVRHRFGDQRKDRNENDFDSAAPFVGTAGEFQFSCPNVDSAEEAVLQFQHRGSHQAATFPSPQPDGGLVGLTAEHPVRVNGRQLSGGVPAAPRRGEVSLWSTRLLLIGKGVLREQNILRIEATANDPVLENIDNFTVDNVVVFYKTKSPSSGPGGTVVAPT